MKPEDLDGLQSWSHVDDVPDIEPTLAILREHYKGPFTPSGRMVPCTCGCGEMIDEEGLKFLMEEPDL